MATSSKGIVAAFSDSEALAALKPGVALYNSPDSPIQSIPEQFSQPSEVQAAYDAFKSVNDAATPNDGKQAVRERNAQRQVFNEKMGNFIDFVALAARKDPSMLAKFGFTFLGQGKSKQATKMAQLLAYPLLILQAIDKDPGTVYCKVRGGAKKGIEIHTAYDDPSNESNWNRFDSYVNVTFTMTGLPSGRRAYIRGRYIFSQGKKGPWSEMVSIMVP
jgi:hypothetical protein